MQKRLFTDSVILSVFSIPIVTGRRSSTTLHHLQLDL
jgi:hypothetical protein